LRKRKNNPLTLHITLKTCFYAYYFIVEVTQSGKSYKLFLPQLNGYCLKNQYILACRRGFIPVFLLTKGNDLFTVFKKNKNHSTKGKPKTIDLCRSILKRVRRIFLQHELFKEVLVKGDW
jgi:hypothetical protein